MIRVLPRVLDAAALAEVRALLPQVGLQDGRITNRAAIGRAREAPSLRAMRRRARCQPSARLGERRGERAP